MDYRQELRYANEGLDQIHKAYEAGEYSDKVQYERDVKQQAEAIARLEKKLA